VAQLLVQMFVAEFPATWPTFFDDVLSLMDSDVPITFDFLFRVLKTIDESVIDRVMNRTGVRSSLVPCIPLVPISFGVQRSPVAHLALGVLTG
jgi:hypothetical protein